MNNKCGVSAKVSFCDVDGNAIELKFWKSDIERLLSFIGCEITDIDNFRETHNDPSHDNGIIDISKPVHITIYKGQCV